MIIQYYCFDVIPCHVSHFSLILVVGGGTKEAHDDVPLHQCYPYGSGAIAGILKFSNIPLREGRSKPVSSRLSKMTGVNAAVCS